MSEIKEHCCGSCIWYNGDMRDSQAFCDDREEYVQLHNYCYRYRNNEMEQLKEQIDDNKNRR